MRKLIDRISNTAWLVAFCLLVLPLLTGCYDWNRVVWSPDGAHLAFIAHDGLHLSTDAGQLSGPFSDRGEIIEWYPDSKQLLLLTNTHDMDWTQINELADDEEQEIIRTAQIVKEELRTFKGTFTPEEAKRMMEKLYARLGANKDRPLNHNLPEALKYLNAVDIELKGALSNDWYNALTRPQSRYSSNDKWVAQNYCLKDKELSPAKVLLTTTRFPSLRISPTGNMLAGVDDTGLWIMSASGGQRKVLCRDVAMFPDWLPDGKSLLVIRRPTEQSVSGKVSRVKITTNEHSTSNGSVPPAVEDLCDTVYHPDDRVRCLKDGTILFSGSAKDTDSDDLFELKPGTRIPIQIASRGRRNGLAALSFFEVSPDERKVTIPSHKGDLDVLMLDERKLIHVQSLHEHPEEIPFAPHWRSAHELCYPKLSRIIVEKDQTSKVGRFDIALWSYTTSSHRTISDKWPQDIMGSFMELSLRTTK